MGMMKETRDTFYSSNNQLCLFQQSTTLEKNENEKLDSRETLEHWTLNSARD
jgi:hypothetical protein